MNSLTDLKIGGLKGLKVSRLKDLILKPKTADVNLENDIEYMDYLTKGQEQVKKKIIKLIKEKKEIEARIDLIRKAEKEKSEEISELPCREEISLPLSRKVREKISGPLEVKNDYLHAKETGFSEEKVSGMEIEVKGIDKKSEDKTPEGKISEDIIPNNSQTIIANDAEGADPKSGAVNENKVSSGNASESSIKKSKPESKNNPAASLFGDSLIEDLLNSEDLNPEEEQGFMKYLEEQEVGELITDLKNVKALLARAENAG